VPRNVVSAYVYVSYRSWLSVPDKKGEAHNESNLRNVQEEVVRCYRECWDVLEQPTDNAPCWLQVKGPALPIASALRDPGQGA
jgi:hypothetical protein